MTFTEFLTYIVWIVPIVLCPLISTLVRYLEVRYLEGTANIELQELEKDMEKVLSYGNGVTVRQLNEYSPDLMVVSQTRSITDYIKPKTDYICNYCGTRYVSDENGFIPNCHNCGARLDKEK